MDKKEEIRNKKKYIHNLYKKKQYEEILKVSDDLQSFMVWDIQLLLDVVQACEQLGYLQKAQNYLLYVYNHKESRGRAELYKLAELSMKLGDSGHLEAVYQEYLKRWPDNPECFLIGYYIACLRKDLPENCLYYLERYCSVELKENWSYELARLYKEAGRSEDCARICHDIIFMFGFGEYVEKSIELLKECRELTELEEQTIAEQKAKQEQAIKEQQEAERRKKEEEERKKQEEQAKREEKKRQEEQAREEERIRQAERAKEEETKAVVRTDSLANILSSLHLSQPTVSKHQPELSKLSKLESKDTSEVKGHLIAESEEVILEKVKQQLEQMIEEFEHIYETSAENNYLEFAEEMVFTQESEANEKITEEIRIQSQSENLICADNIISQDIEEADEAVEKSEDSNTGGLKDIEDIEDTPESDSINTNTIENIGKAQHITPEEEVCQFTIDVLQYAKEHNAELDEMAYLTVSLIAGQKQRLGINLTKALAGEITEQAIQKAQKKTSFRLLNLKQKQYNRKGKIVLTDKHFEED